MLDKNLEQLDKQEKTCMTCSKPCKERIDPNFCYCDEWEMKSTETITPKNLELDYNDYFNIVINSIGDFPKTEDDMKAINKAWEIVVTPIKENLKDFIEKYYNRLCSKHPECKNMPDVLRRRILDIVISETWRDIKEKLIK